MYLKKEITQTRKKKNNSQLENKQKPDSMAKSYIQYKQQKIILDYQKECLTQ